MSWQAISGNPFFTVALPIVIAMFLNGFWSNKRIDDLRSEMNRQFGSIDRRFDAVDGRFDGVDRRFDQVDRRLEQIETKLDGHAERIARLEGPALVRSGD